MALDLTTPFRSPLRSQERRSNNLAAAVGRSIRRRDGPGAGTPN